MAQDYSTVSEESVHVCAFLLLRKTSMGHHLLPLGYRNHLRRSADCESMFRMLIE